MVLITSSECPAPLIDFLVTLFLITLYKFPECHVPEIHSPCGVRTPYPGGCAISGEAGGDLCQESGGGTGAGVRGEGREDADAAHRRGIQEVLSDGAMFNLETMQRHVPSSNLALNGMYAGTRWA